MLSLAVAAGAFTAGWIHVRHKKVEAERAAYEQKIDNCIVDTLRGIHASRKRDERKAHSGEPTDAFDDVWDQVAADTEVEQARVACVSDEAYDRKHKHDRELYQKAFPKTAGAH